ncbi:hypothetical protein [Thalassomonas actiniarum]|uniref:Uncharacterized protein n=1 Tax=Thalassomonas actiniarum TaxID=485447 RepID=A0AAE9YQW6_9GAMM|nr:hypothetical protein [Thalassomonas actiniarum]WDD99196.1 hypothetical protein SG35_000455 [Thalassomonas actiniarum]
MHPFSLKKENIEQVTGGLTFDASSNLPPVITTPPIIGGGTTTVLGECGYNPLS